MSCDHLINYKGVDIRVFFDEMSGEMLDLWIDDMGTPHRFTTLSSLIEHLDRVIKK